MAAPDGGVDRRRPRAHQSSSASAIGLFRLWFCLLERGWPIPWIGPTVAFEVGLGRLSRRSTSEMLLDYDPRRGHVWPLSCSGWGSGRLCSALRCDGATSYGESHERCFA